MGLIKLLNKENLDMDVASRTMLDVAIAVGNRRILKGNIKDISDGKILELCTKRNKLIGNIEIPNNELYWIKKQNLTFQL